MNYLYKGQEITEKTKNTFRREIAKAKKKMERIKARGDFTTLSPKQCQKQSTDLNWEAMYLHQWEDRLAIAEGTMKPEDLADTVNFSGFHEYKNPVKNEFIPAGNQ